MYQIVNLLERNGSRIEGPMSPVMAAKQLAQYMGSKISGLCRVMFNDSKIYNEPDGDGWTSYDHLIMKSSYSNTNVFYFFIDLGIGLSLIAGYDSSAPEEIIKGGDYERFTNRLNQNELIDLFKKVQHNPEYTKIAPAKTKIHV